MTKFKNLLIFSVGLFCCAQSFAQTNPPSGTVKLFFEKVFVQTDRTVYAPGEDIWLKAYLTNARDGHLMGTSKNLHAELLGPTGNIMVQDIISINKGTGLGDFALPDDLPAGKYKLRAYTNWMRNFGDNFIFEKAITITGNQPTAKTAATTAKSAAGPPAASGAAMGANGAPVIRFFPEGGSLVTDISAMVAVKAEDGAGSGIALTGAPILSATGDTVAHFTTDSLGMGLFNLLPLAGQTYYSFIKYKGQNFKVALPAVLKSGLALKVTKRDTLFYITVSCNAADAAIYADKTLSLSAKHAGAVVFEQQLKLTENYATLKLPESLLPDGIAILTLYDDQHKPNCERLIYADQGGKAKLIVSTGKSSYQSRERITVNIKATDGKNQPLTGDFSLAAVDAAVDVPNGTNIKSYLMLQSDLRSPIANANRYFDTTNVNRVRQMDLLLLTQGWREFVWRRLADTALKISYLPEQGFTLSGRVKKDNSNDPVPGANVTLSAPKATGQRLFFSKTDTNGNYYFDNLLLFGSQNIRVTTRDDKARANGKIELDSLTRQGIPAAKTPWQPIGVMAPAVIAELQRRAPLNKALEDVTHLKEVKIKASQYVTLRDQVAATDGHPDEILTVTPDDVKSFKTLKQYILYASKQAKQNPNFNPARADDDIVFMADGGTFKPRIIVDNKEAPFTEDDDEDMQAHYYSVYYNLSMDVVEKVVIKRLLGAPKALSGDFTTSANVLGNSIAGVRSSGIKPIFVIYLTLKPGALLKNGTGIMTADISGYYEARTFYKPMYAGMNANSQKPDVRSTIHWEPVIKTDANGQATVSFYNADPKTKIQVIVQGITDTGLPLAGSKVYTVK